MLSKHIGLGVELNDVIAITGDNCDYYKKVYQDYSSWNGTFRLDFMAGVRFYF